MDNVTIKAMDKHSSAWVERAVGARHQPPRESRRLRGRVTTPLVTRIVASRLPQPRPAGCSRSVPGDVGGSSAWAEKRAGQLQDLVSPAQLAILALTKLPGPPDPAPQRLRSATQLSEQPTGSPPTAIHVRRCSATIRTARSCTSGENFECLFIAPSSQGMEPPANPGRFSWVFGTGPSLGWAVMAQIVELRRCSSSCSATAVEQTRNSRGPGFR